MFESGKFFFRTVTYHALGNIVERQNNFVKLEDASWVADSGRFSKAIENGDKALLEVEYVGTMYVNLDTVTDAFPWEHDLPKAAR
jgi:hypothetical protein